VLLVSESLMPELVTTAKEAMQRITQARSSGETIGLIPTMGALHDGHLSLVQAAKAECLFTVATIFVNPTQFGPDEDLDQYPRTLEQDMEALAAHDVDFVFSPNASEVYPSGFSTYVDPPDVAKPLEGEYRPGHFRGVCTVVLKLFNLVPADIAYFGEKDYQQLLVIRHMARDLNLPIEIRPCATVREPDGLAMSSRNAYLSDDERRQALALSDSLALANDLVANGETRSASILDEMKRVFKKAGIENIDYIALADPDTLQDVPAITQPTQALVAAHVGNTRLIDNRRIG